MKANSLFVSLVALMPLMVSAVKPVEEPVVAADITSPVQLEDIFNAVHELFLPPLPGDAVYIHLEKQIYFVDWNSGEWEQELLSQAVGELRTLGGLMYPEYTFYVLLDYSGDLVIYNGDSTAVFRRTVDYDPYFWALAHFGLSDASELTLAQRELYHAAKSGAEIRVVPVSFAESYLEEEAMVAEQEALAVALAEPMAMAMSFPAVVTNLLLGIEDTTNGVAELELRWPAGFTNRLEVFATTNLVARGWQLVCTNIVTDGSTNLVWQDAASSNLACRFYSLGNADLDTDGDGLVDSRELYLYGSNPSTNHTDTDGQTDYEEVAGGSDPSDSASFLASLSGTFLPVESVSGDFLGTVSADGFELDFQSTGASYSFTNLVTLKNYSISVFRDTNPNGIQDLGEEFGSTNLTLLDSILGLDLLLGNSDADSDGMPDAWELEYCGGNVDPGGDMDFDGVSNLDEYLNGSNPLNPDSDGDGAPDGVEVGAGTSSTNPASVPASVRGLVVNGGAQSGTVYVLANPTIGDWSLSKYAVAGADGAYRIEGLDPSGSYYIRAFVDVNGNGA
ncbi:MAG: hypothetical protein ABFR47_09250, partial [Verrucomicrobiota bacterium]